jgi:protein-S-isoprenylcysteine O-methyltransferase Ste14
MIKLIVFVVLSLPVIIVSWRTLFNIKIHGFYRFFSWECILWLFVANYEFWFDDPFSINQIFSWIFLFISVYLVVSGALQIKKNGKPGAERDGKALYRFEKTSELVDTGIYKYIRHPLYSSLIFLTWGLFLKHTTVLLLFVALISTVFLFLTSIFDEKECVIFFGAKYREYMKRSKRFIPYIF